MPSTQRGHDSHSQTRHARRNSEGFAMDGHRFDALARTVAVTSRRQLLRAMAAGALGGVLGSRASVAGAADKVFVCHKGKTQSIAASALPAHLGHGDTEGPCCLQSTTCRPDQTLTITAS